MVADPRASSYIHKDLTFPPLTKFQVKVKAFNSKGEGPFSLPATIFSAQDGESRHSFPHLQGRPRPLPSSVVLQLANTLPFPQNEHCGCSRNHLTRIPHVSLRGILIPRENVAIFPSQSLLGSGLS